MTDKLRVDQADLTLRELGQVEELLGVALSTAFEQSQTRAIAALVCVVKRRADPAFTLDQALDIKMGDLEIVGPESPGEVLGGVNGTSPQLSPVTGA